MREPIGKLVYSSADGKRTLSFDTYFDRSLQGTLPSFAKLPAAIADALSSSRRSDDLAQAVIEARDGAWQVVPIAATGKDSEDGFGVVLDGPNLPDWVAKVALDDIAKGVAAVVGRDTVHDIGGTDLGEPRPELPETFTGVPLASVKTRSESPFKGRELGIIGRGSALYASDSFEDALEKAALSVRDGITPTVAVVQQKDGFWLQKFDSDAEPDAPVMRGRDIDSASAKAAGLRAIVGTQQQWIFDGDGTSASGKDS